MSRWKKHERMYQDLTDKEREVIKAIKTVDDIKTVEYVDDWEDDHIVCVGARINGVEMGFWWVGPQYAGAFEYSDSPKARKSILELITDAVRIGEEDLRDSIEHEEWKKKVRKLTKSHKTFSVKWDCKPVPAAWNKRLMIGGSANVFLDGEKCYLGVNGDDKMLQRAINQCVKKPTPKSKERILTALKKYFKD